MDGYREDECPVDFHNFVTAAGSVTWRSLHPCMHWMCESCKKKCAMVTRPALQAAALVPDLIARFRGRDVQEAGQYSRLELVRAWRVESATKWRNYRTKQQVISVHVTT